MTVHDAYSALLVIIKQVHHQVFALEIEIFLCNKLLSKPMRNHLYPGLLQAFVDDNGLILYYVMTCYENFLLSYLEIIV